MSEPKSYIPTDQHGIIVATRQQLDPLSGNPSEVNIRTWLWGKKPDRIAIIPSKQVFYFIMKGCTCGNYDWNSLIVCEKYVRVFCCQVEVLFKVFLMFVYLTYFVSLYL